MESDDKMIVVKLENEEDRCKNPEEILTIEVDADLYEV